MAPTFEFQSGKQVKRVLLFIFEGLGTSELILILVVALVIFGPRKLPQLSRSLGKSLADFKRSSEDFKQTWEKEVARESIFKEGLIGEAMLPEDRSILGENRDRTEAVLDASEYGKTDALGPYTTSPPATADTSSVAGNATAASTDTPEPPPKRKRDWL